MHNTASGRVGATSAAHNKCIVTVVRISSRNSQVLEIKYASRSVMTISNMTDQADHKMRLANRVFQLEAHRLDNELYRIIDQFVDQLDLPFLRNEAKLLFKLYICANHLKQNRTIGMKIFSIIFSDTKIDSSSNTILKFKLISLAICDLILPYLMVRYEKLEQSVKLPHPILTLENINILHKTLKVFNFLAFLRTGMYSLIQERLLGLSLVMPEEKYYDNMCINYAQMELMGLESIWSKLAELLNTAIPYINMEKIKNMSLKLTSFASNKDIDLKLSEKLFNKEYTSKCAICNNQPFNPHIIGCRHVFCYYCIQAKYQADKASGYTCSLCNHKAIDETQLQRYRLITSTRWRITNAATW